MNNSDSVHFQPLCLDATDEVTTQEESLPEINFQSKAGFWPMEPKVKKKLLKGGIGVLLVMLLVIIIALAVNESASGSKCFTCTSEKCILSANNLLQSMDRSIDPCDDFYNFTCGNWKRQHPIPDTSVMHSWLYDRTRYNIRKLRDFLRSDNIEKDKEPIPWQKAKMMYRSCMDENKLQSLGIEPVVKILEEIGLRGPSELWSNSTKPTSNWYAVAAKAKKILSLDLMIGFKIQPFFKSGENRIILNPPQDADFLPGYLKIEELWRFGPFSFLAKQNQQIDGSKPDPKKVEFVLRLMDQMSIVFGQMFNKSNTDTMGMARKVLILEVEIGQAANFSMDGKLEKKDLKELLEVLNGTQNLTDIDEKEMIQISLDDFQKYTDGNRTGSSQIDWREYFHIMFENVNVSVSGGDKIIVAKPKYFKSLNGILSNSTRDIVDMLIYWKVVNSMAGHLTEEIRRSKENFVKFVTGTEAKEARSIVCTKAVSHTMEMALLSYLIHSEFSNTTGQKVDEVFTNIRKAFTSMVKASEWLDSNTKNMIMEKAKAIHIMTSYSKWNLDHEKVEEYYQQVELNDGKFLQSSVNISKWKMQKYLTSVSTGLVTEELLINPLEINAYYLPVHNSITVLSGYLQFPFFDLGHDALNYGSLGFTLGHELHHAFDIRGILTKTANTDAWYNISTLEQFVDKRQCFIENYSKYGWGPDLKVSGDRTADENMPDNGGLQASLLAYKALMGKEPKLPGLEDFTHEQVFFLSFANFFCTNIKEYAKKLALQDVHTPNAFRLLGAVINSKEFSRIWGCRKGTQMNPQYKKCYLW